MDKSGEGGIFGRIKSLFRAKNPNNGEGDGCVTSTGYNKDEKNLARFTALASNKYLSLNVMRPFAHLLDYDDITFRQELELIDLRREADAKESSKEKLKEELFYLDQKIEVMVRNKKVLQETMASFKKLKQKNHLQIEEMMAKGRRARNCPDYYTFQEPRYDADMEKLLVLTESLVLGVIRVQPGETLLEVLQTPATSKQQKKHMDMIRNTPTICPKATDRTATPYIFGGHLLPLHRKKAKILRNLQTLQQAGLLSEGEGYQQIINKISDDILHQKYRCQQQKGEIAWIQQFISGQTSEIQRLQEQIDLYQSLLKSSLGNLFKTTSRCSRKIKKYTAAKLAKKGVIKDLDENTKKQFFHITPAAADHQFVIRFGDETSQIQFEDLLKLHYERTGTLKIFSYHFSVPLLLFLIYSKFYSK